jgi:hypothetical protein
MGMIELDEAIVKSPTPVLLVEVVVTTALTVKVAKAESPTDPVTVTVKEPAAKLATTNDPVNVPPDTEQV